MQLPKGIDDYLRAFESELGERILRSYPPLHAVEDPASPLLGQLLRSPFPAQTLAIMGVVTRWDEARAAGVIAECGTGKTLISLAAAHVHSGGRPFTALAMVPPQLVEKWAREAFRTLPRIRVFFIDGLRTQTSSNGHAGVNEVRLRSRSPDAVKKALEYMNQAIAKDPSYALAYAGLADCYVILANRGVISGEEAYTKGVAAAQRALELDATLAEPHAALALLRETHDFNWAGAEAEFKRAIELNPNYATAHQWYGLLLGDMGRFEEARQQTETARGLDPLSLIIQVNVGEFYDTMHQFDRAVEEFRKVSEMDPNFPRGHLALADVYLRKRMYQEAAAEVQKGFLLDNEPEAAALYEGVADEASYRRAVSRQIILLTERAKTRYVSPMTIADLYVRLGDNEQAIAWLEKAYHEHASGLTDLKTAPLYDPVRSDPRFQDLLRSLRFPP